MSAIRPDLPAFNPPTSPASMGAAREAQAAFFRTALGQTSAAAPASEPRPAPVSAQQVAVQTTATSAGAAAPAPGPSLRPGSLLDIRI